MLSAVLCLEEVWQRTCASATILLIEFAMKLVGQAEVEGTSFMIFTDFVSFKVRRLPGCGFAYRFKFTAEARCGWL